MFFRNSRSSLPRSSTHCRKSHITKFFDGSSEDEEDLSDQVKQLIELRQQSREHIESLGIMVPIYPDENETGEEIPTSPVRFPVPLLPKPALTQLHMNDQELNTVIVDENCVSDTTSVTVIDSKEKAKRESTISLVGSTKSVIEKEKAKRESTYSIVGSTKSVTFDYVEVLEYSDNDDEEVPDELTEADLTNETTLGGDIPLYKISS